MRQRLLTTFLFFVALSTEDLSAGYLQHKWRTAQGKETIAGNPKPPACHVPLSASSQWKSFNLRNTNIVRGGDHLRWQMRF